MYVYEMYVCLRAGFLCMLLSTCRYLSECITQETAICHRSRDLNQGYNGQTNRPTDRQRKRGKRTNRRANGQGATQRDGKKVGDDERSGGSCRWTERCRETDGHINTNIDRLIHRLAERPSRREIYRHALYVEKTGEGTYTETDEQEDEQTNRGKILRTNEDT